MRMKHARHWTRPRPQSSQRLMRRRRQQWPMLPRLLSLAVRILMIAKTKVHRQMLGMGWQLIAVEKLNCTLLPTLHLQPWKPRRQVHPAQHHNPKSSYPHRAR